jgi:IMP dehydrogenase/GMP reductase
MSNQKKAVQKDLLTSEQVKTYNGLTSIAAKVRFLATVTQDRGTISRYMTEVEGREVRYQWVRNVLLTPLKRS